MMKEFQETRWCAVMVRESFLDLRDNFCRIVDPAITAKHKVAKSGLSLSDQLRRNDVITTTIAEALMAPTSIYVKQVLEIISDSHVKGIAHITGGGFTDNIPRVFPSDLGAKIFIGSWEVTPVFKWIQQAL